MYNVNDERVGKRPSSFFSHFVMYITVNVSLLIIWVLTGADANNFWPLWVIGGWAIALLFHAVNYFLLSGNRR